MTIPLKRETSGDLELFTAANVLDIDVVEPRSGGHIIIGATLGAGDEVRLGVASRDVRIMGPLSVDGTLDMTAGAIINCDGLELVGVAGHTLQAQDTATGATTIDWNDGNHHRLTLTGNVTLSFTDLAVAGGNSVVGIIKVIQGSGSYTITWSNIASWVGGVAPGIAAIPNTDGMYIQAIWDGSEYIGVFTETFVS